MIVRISLLSEAFHIPPIKVDGLLHGGRTDIDLVRTLVIMAFSFSLPKITKTASARCCRSKSLL
jgi:hypothetical protein